MEAAARGRDVTSEHFDSLAPELTHAILDALTFDKVVPMITRRPSYFNTCLLSHAYYGRLFGSLQHTTGYELGRLADALLLFYELSDQLRTWVDATLPQTADFIPHYPSPLWGMDMRNLNRRESVPYDIDIPLRADGWREGVLNPPPAWQRQCKRALCAVSDCVARAHPLLRTFRFFNDAGSKFYDPAIEYVCTAEFGTLAAQLVCDKSKELRRRLRQAAELHRRTDSARYQSAVVRGALDPSTIHRLRSDFGTLMMRRPKQDGEEVSLKVPPEFADDGGTTSAPGRKSGDMSPFRLMGWMWAHVLLVDVAESVIVPELERRVKQTLEELPDGSVPILRYYFEAETLRLGPSAVAVEGKLDVLARRRKHIWLPRLDHKLSRVKARQLLFLADLLDKHPALLAQSSRPERVPCGNSGHVSRSLRDYARRLARDNVFSRCESRHGRLPHAYQCRHVFKAVELPLVPLGKDLDHLCAFVSRNPLPEADVATLSPGAASALAEFAPPAAPGSRQNHDYPDAVKSDLRTVFECMRHIVRGAQDLDPATLELLPGTVHARVKLEPVNRESRRVAIVPYAKEMRQKGGRRVIVPPYSEELRRRRPAKRRPSPWDTWGFGVEDEQQPAPWIEPLVPPFEQRELDWLAAYLNAYVYIQSVG